MKYYKISNLTLVKVVIWWFVLYGIIIGFAIFISDRMPQAYKIFFSLIGIFAIVNLFMEYGRLKSNYIEVNDTKMRIEGKGVVKRYSTKFSWDDVIAIKSDVKKYLSYPPLKMIVVKTKYTSIDIELNIYEEYHDLLNYIYSKTKNNEGFKIDSEIIEMMSRFES